MSAGCRPLPLVLLARFHHNIPLPLTVSCCVCGCADITADFHCLSARSRNRPEPQQGPAVLLLINFLYLCAPHSLSFRNGASCRPALTSRTTRRPKARLFLIVPEAMLHCMCFSIVLCRHAWRQRRRWGGKPATGLARLSGCVCAPHTGWLFFKLFRKTFFDAEIEAHVYFSLSLWNLVFRSRLSREAC